MENIINNIAAQIETAEAKAAEAKASMKAATAQNEYDYFSNIFVEQNNKVQELRSDLFAAQARQAGWVK